MQKQILNKQFYKKWFFYLMLIGLVAIGVMTTLYIQHTNNAVTNNRVETVITQPEPAYIMYTAIKGKTSLEQLKETTARVQTKTTSNGEYVDSIGSLVGGAGGNYWSFYIDSKMANVGAGGYIQNGGEKIEWKFQK